MLSRAFGFVAPQHLTHAGRQWLGMSMFMLSMVAMPVAWAADFFTIIGPDGRPIVVPANIEKPAANATQKKTVVAPPVTPTQTHSSSHNALTTPAAQRKIVAPELKAPEAPSSLISSPAKLAHANTDASIKVTKPVQTIAPDAELTNSQVAAASASNTSTQNTAVAASATQVPLNEPQGSATNSNRAVVENDPNSPFTRIGGEQYVNSEYLEDKEFNLDDKKRFYVLPEGVIDRNASGVRGQTIERTKGVSRSFLNSVLNRAQPSVVPEPALVLSSNYYRMPKAQVEQTLEQSCFSGKAFKKPKAITADKALALFPKAPLKDTFDYELVKVAEPLQDVRLTSYSASDSKPKFYWPFVVFLDDNGCVIEAVSGFKTDQLPATMLQHTAIEGLIKLPTRTRYLLLTPLATAIDVEEAVLSNQGQITLTAIR